MNQADVSEMVGYFQYFPIRFEMERRKAEALNSMGFLGEKDVVWTVASGPFGLETAAYGEYAGQSIGIDTSLPPVGKIGNCFYIARTIEEVIEDLSVPRPNFVISNKYSGISEVLNDILEMETEPTCMLSPCGCENCREEYYPGRMPKSMQFQKKFSGKSYVGIDKENPARIDALDMAETAREVGYGAAIFGLPANNRIVYMTLMTKNQDILKYLTKEGASFLVQ